MIHFWYSYSLIICENVIRYLTQGWVGTGLSPGFGRVEAEVWIQMFLTCCFSGNLVSTCCLRPRSPQVPQLGTAFQAWAGPLGGQWKIQQSTSGLQFHQGRFATKRDRGCSWERLFVPIARLELGLRSILRISDFDCSWRSHSFGQSRGPSLHHSKSFFGLVSFK